MIVSFDEHSPISWEETALHTLSGDLGSKWADKSLALVSFKNGKFGYIGEVRRIEFLNLDEHCDLICELSIFQHGCYDGTIFNSLRKFHVLSMLEYPEPDWDGCFMKVTSNLMEIKFDVDDLIENESRRIMPSLKEMVSRCRK